MILIKSPLSGIHAPNTVLCLLAPLGELRFVATEVKRLSQSLRVCQQSAFPSGCRPLPSRSPPRLGSLEGLTTTVVVVCPAAITCTASFRACTPSTLAACAAPSNWRILSVSLCNPIIAWGVKSGSESCFFLLGTSSRLHAPSASRCRSCPRSARAKCRSMDRLCQVVGARRYLLRRRCSLPWSLLAV